MRKSEHRPHGTPLVFDDASKMADERRPDMADLTVLELKTEMDGRFAAVDARFAAIDRRFDRVEARISEGAVATRRHFDVVAEQLKAEMKLLVEGCYTGLDHHERRLQALEKRRS